jgi:hypothetical protein
MEAEIKGLLVLALSSPEHWKGKGGKSDFAVLIAFLRTALVAGTLTVGVSIRRAGEAAGLNKETAHHSIRSLLDKKWIRLMKKFHADKPNQYALCRYDTSRTVVPPSSLPRRVEQLYDLCRNDVFRWKGLGKSAALVLSVLDEQSRHVPEIAESLGISRRTVERCVKRLSKYRLAVKETGGWRRGDANLDAVAKDLGVYGTGDRQHGKHEKEREEYIRSLGERGKNLRTTVQQPFATDIVPNVDEDALPPREAPDPIWLEADLEDATWPVQETEEEGAWESDGQCDDDVRIAASWKPRRNGSPPKE